MHHHTIFMNIFNDAFNLIILVIIVGILVWIISSIGKILGQNTSVYTGLLMVIVIFAFFIFIKKGLDL